MDRSGRFRINSPKVIHETIDGETVIVNLDTGNYYSLNRVAADIWSLIGTGVASHRIIDDLSGLYSGEGQEMERAVLQFIEELKEEALIVTDSSDMSEDDASLATPAHLPLPQEKKAFEAPVLQKYSDMQDLLLLDPIHEVDDAGWPNVKTADT